MFFIYQVIGDKKGTSTTRHLINFLNASSTTPNRFAALKNAIGVPVKFIHLVRNPFDNIATMTLRAAHPRLRKKAKKDNLQVRGIFVIFFSNILTLV